MDTVDLNKSQEASGSCEPINSTTSLTEKIISLAKDLFKSLSFSSEIELYSSGKISCHENYTNDQATSSLPIYPDIGTDFRLPPDFKFIHPSINSLDKLRKDLIQKTKQIHTE